MTSSAFVFIKPHAVTEEVKQLVTKKLKEAGVSIVSEGTINAEKIDKEKLIDTHYGAIAAKAVKQKPTDLTVQPKAQEEFEKAFGLSWSDALGEGLVYNAVYGCAKLGTDFDGLGKKWATLKKGVNLLKFGGGFYCGKVDDIFVINGFYMDMRKAFTKPGTCIHYYQTEFSALKLSWADFRGKVLGGTDPKTAEAGSLRNLIYSDWKALKLKAEPDMGDNGVHASASPFEAMAERVNWLGSSISADSFGKSLLTSGVHLKTISAWTDDPPVLFEGKKQSLFDLLEDLDGEECVLKSVKIASENTPTEAAGQRKPPKKSNTRLVVGLTLAAAAVMMLLLLVGLEYFSVVTVIGLFNRHELTEAKWESATAGKTLFLKFYAPWCGHCKSMKPSWDKLMADFKDDPKILVTDVNCIGAGKSLCATEGVGGFPTIKYGDPHDLKTYSGGRTYNDLSAFAKGLGPSCSPGFLDVCSQEQKAQIDEYTAMSFEKREAAIKEKLDQMAEIKKKAEAKMESLKQQYQEGLLKKDAEVQKIKDGGLGLLKAVDAFEEAKNGNTEL